MSNKKPIIKFLIIVPARSGSKGVKDKNIRQLNGKPLLYWTAKAIKDAKISNSLAVLSTDSDKYAQIGIKYGLNIPYLRPLKLSKDNSLPNEIIYDLFDWFKKTHHYLPKYIMWLQPTSPFRTNIHIEKALNLITQDNIDSVIGCTQIYRDTGSLFNNHNKYLKALSNQNKNTIRQDISPLLTPNGLIYLSKTKSFIKNKSFFPKKTIPLICDKISSIDTEEDWLIAESLMKQDINRYGEQQNE